MGFFRDTRNKIVLVIGTGFILWLTIVQYNKYGIAGIFGSLVFAIIFYALFLLYASTNYRNEIKFDVDGITISGYKYNDFEDPYELNENMIKELMYRDTPREEIKNRVLNLKKDIKTKAKNRVRGVDDRKRILITWDSIESWQIDLSGPYGEQETVIKVKIKDLKQCLDIPYKRRKYFNEFIPEKRLKSEYDDKWWLRFF